LRKAFVETLCSLAECDPRIVLLTGDLGFLALEPFRDRFPNRFFNMGVAEQNMIGIATGLAEAGFHPYAYSISTFASLRPFEFIRNGPVSHRFDVRIVGMGAGFEYGHSGFTHYGIEDVAVMRTLPGISIIIPADSEQAASAIRATCDIAGPIYYSLGKDDKAIMPGLAGRFELGSIQVTGDGGNAVILTMGSVSREAAAAAEQLAQSGVHVTVAVISNFHPDPDDDVRKLLKRFSYGLTVEAQTTSGGLGAYVASIIAESGLPCRLRMLGVRTRPDGTSGNQQDRWRKHGLDRESIVDTVLGMLKLQPEL
jgi:transketolase